MVLSLCLSCPSPPRSSVLKMCAWGTPVLERGCHWPPGLGDGREQPQPQAPSAGEAAHEMVVLVVKWLQKP